MKIIVALVFFIICQNFEQNILNALEECFTIL